jgi:thiol:disulfide interchange protein DsbC
MISKLLLVITAIWMSFQPACADDDTAKIRQVLSELVGDAKPDSITPAPLPGFYEVSFGPMLVYVSKDGRYILQGDLLDVRERRNLTEEARSAKRITALDAVGEDKMIVFAPDKVKHTITVFTDIDCGYCRKLHQQIKDFNDQGIKVRYLAFPRAGVGSAAFEKAVSVWCADDKQAAITRAKAGEAVAKKTCENPPVAEQYELGQRLGINGTPTIVLEDGKMLPGYIPPRQLGQMLEVKSAHP